MKNLLNDYNRQDIFGFYKIGNFKTYSQIEAVEIHRKINLPIVWHFNDEVYGSFDWSKEPSESISELYIKRCLQLREKYDYLVLFYSAGADSDNIFNFFIDNNIKLDEVVTLVDYESTQNKMSLINAEIFGVAIPKIELAKQKQPHLLHTVIDTRKIILEHYSRLNLDGIYEQNFSFAPLTIVRQKSKYSQENWNKMFSSGKKVGFIFGNDKPKIEFDGRMNFISYFSSSGVAGATGPLSQNINNEFEFTELFYWSPDAPKIPIKQAHIIKNFVKQKTPKAFKKTPIYVNGVIRQPLGGAFTLVHDGNFLQNEDLNRLIYPYWYNIPYQYRAVSLILMEKESWFIDKMNTELQAKNWKIITKKVLEITNTDYRIQTSFNHAVQRSKNYNLGN